MCICSVYLWHVWGHACAHMWKSEVAVRSLPQMLLNPICWSSLLLKSKIQQHGKSHEPVCPGDPVPLLRLGLYLGHHRPLAFTWVLGFWVLALRLGQQALELLNYLPARTPLSLLRLNFLIKQASRLFLPGYLHEDIRKSQTEQALYDGSWKHSMQFLMNIKFFSSA